MRAAQWEGIVVLAICHHMITQHESQIEVVYWVIAVIAFLVLLVGFLPELDND